MQVVSVVGARPQFVKLAPIDKELRLRGIEHIIVHTGQHYDHNMSESFFELLDIPKPDFNLGIGSASHAGQTASMLEPLEKVFLKVNPSWVLVYGDTNSTLAAALAAIKIHKPLAHLEAGLRSFNRAMPEEHNRVLTDHASDLLLAPTQTAMNHLANEGLSAKSILVGDVMTDVCLNIAATQGTSFDPKSLVGDSPFYVATIHRAENTDSPERLCRIIETLAGLDHPVLLTVHPRLAKFASEYGISLMRGSLRTTAPLSYPEMVSAVMQARGVVTDSGGLQKEAFLLKTACVTLRTETEWVETVELGVNLVDNLATSEQISDFITDAANNSWPTETPYGDGKAAENVALTLRQHQVD
ncbi:MAG: UDP-N-acetylglucosamine 2-epimerase (non-hydrolyzing) [Actinobacteria bacterium]|nr:UDP-N-acetylglucosamine 2-epimerase (non-hydrolyzing) [Actinomycetota bacterium]